jgi:uncharacterized protein YegP (UPF0339 family)
MSSRCITTAEPAAQSTGTAAADVVDLVTSADPGRRSATMAAKFEIITDQAGKFRFHLKASNGEIIAASQAYETKDNAKNGIASIQENATDATVVDLSE